MLTNRVKTLCQNLLAARESLRQALNNHCGLNIGATAKLLTYAMYISAGVKVRNPEAEPGDVNFFDYDGTLRYSYSATEFASLTALPKLPAHTGLTSQSWNWTLADAKTEVATTGKLNIGLSCAPTDGYTRLFVRIPDDNFFIEINFINGNSGSGLTCDWGDGTILTTVNSSLSNALLGNGHIYASKGEYIIKLTPYGSGSITLGHTNSKPIIGNSLSESTCNYRLCSVLYKVWLGTTGIIYAYQSFFCQFGLEAVAIPQSPSGNIRYPFRYNHNLKFIVYPNSNKCLGVDYLDDCFSLTGISVSKYITQLDSNCFGNCYSLKYFQPTSYITSMSGSWNFTNCHNLQNIKIPSGTTNIGQGAFQNCYAIEEIEIPSGVTSIGANAFNGNHSLNKIYMTPTTPPSIQSNSFVGYAGIKASEFFVPIQSFYKYRTATNYKYSGSNGAFQWNDEQQTTLIPIIPAALGVNNILLITIGSTASFPPFPQVGTTYYTYTGEYFSQVPINNINGIFVINVQSNHVYLFSRDITFSSADSDDVFVEAKLRYYSDDTDGYFLSSSTRKCRIRVNDDDGLRMGDDTMRITWDGTPDVLETID